MVSVYRLNLQNRHQNTPKHVTHVVVEEGVAIIGQGVFNWVYNLQSIVFPEASLRKIEIAAFIACSCLRSILIPKTVTEIGEGAFEKCSSLLEVEFEMHSTLKSIGRHAFRGCISLKKIIIPQSVLALPEYGCFNHCESLESVIFEEGSPIQAFPMHCFSYCRKLKSIVIPDDVTVIGEAAFQYCFELRSIYFTQESKLQHIGAYAFQDCRNLQFLNIPTTMFSIHKDALYQCSAFPVYKWYLSQVEEDAKCAKSAFLYRNQPRKNIEETSFNRNELMYWFHWFTHRFDNFPYHELCYQKIHCLTQEMLDSIPIGDPSLIQQNEMGLTPLHIVCSNPQSNVELITQIYNKNCEAATMVSTKKMTPWHMYLVAKDMLSYDEFETYLSFHVPHRGLKGTQVSKVANILFSKGSFQLEVSDTTKALLSEHVSLNCVHSLIQMGLNYDDDGLYDLTLTLHGVSSFDREYSRPNETSGLCPYMVMAASQKFKLCHVFDVAMKMYSN